MHQGIKKRFNKAILAFLTLGLGLFLVFSSLRDHLVFFFTPTELLVKNPTVSQKIRIGGLVQKNTIKHVGSDQIQFTLTDQTNSLTVIYKGALPDLFREGQGVVAEGFLKKPDFFEAHTILAKHDETYKPPEGASEEEIQALKKRRVNA